MAMLKYRVHEVAKDFGTTSKVITQILTDYMTPPKNHMQVLENPELDVIFEYMTQHNQVESLEDIFKVAPPVEKKPEPAAEEPKWHRLWRRSQNLLPKSRRQKRRPLPPRTRTARISLPRAPPRKRQRRRSPLPHRARPAR